MFIYVDRWNFVNDTIQLTVDDKQFALRANEVLLVGEYSNENGPFSDDHFLVIIDRSGVLFETAVNGNIKEEDVRHLRRLLGSPLRCELIGKTTFYNRVIWPPRFVGRTFMKTRKRILLLRVEYTLDEALIDEVRRARFRRDT